MNNEKKAPVLTLEHLASYLPYETSMQVMREDGSTDYITLNPSKIILIVDGYYCGTEKLILRPLSDLIKVIQHEGRKFIPMHLLKNGGTDLNEFRFLEWKGYSAIDNEEHETCYDPDTMSFYQFYRGDSRMCTKQYEKMQLLFKWHFDVFGLIDQGLAVDINSIEGKETK